MTVESQGSHLLLSDRVCQIQIVTGLATGYLAWVTLGGRGSGELARDGFIEPIAAGPHYVLSAKGRQYVDRLAEVALR